MNRWKPVTERDNPNPYAPGQIDYAVTDADREQAGVHSLAIARQRRQRNAEDERQAKLKRDRELQERLYNGDGPEAA